MEGYVESFRGKKGKDKWGNYVIIVKNNKINIL